MGVSYGLEELDFESLREQEMCLFSQSPRPPVKPTLLPTQWVKMRPEREADNSPTSSAEVKNEWSFASTLPRHLHGVFRER